jgi:membrane associated rhomboid family serine protease
VIPLLPLRNDLPTRRFPSVTLALVAANICVFLWQLSIGPQESIDVFGMIPRNFLSGRTHAGLAPVVTLFTAMFLHGGFLHLAGNMLFLWIFGGNVEDQIGHALYAAFYLLCGLIAGIAQVLVLPTSPLPMVGASGAIAGILGAYFLLFPRSHVLALTLVIWFPFLKLMPVPAVVYLGFWFFMQLFALPSAGGAASSGVAFAAHVGGFLAGLVLVRLFGGRRLLGAASY